MVQPSDPKRGIQGNRHVTRADVTAEKLPSAQPLLDRIVTKPLAHRKPVAFKLMCGGMAAGVILGAITGYIGFLIWWETMPHTGWLIYSNIFPTPVAWIAAGIALLGSVSWVIGRVIDNMRLTGKSDADITDIEDGLLAKPITAQK
jgi:hypothetical protein